MTQGKKSSLRLIENLKRNVTLKEQKEREAKQAEGSANKAKKSLTELSPAKS